LHDFFVSIQGDKEVKKQIGKLKIDFLVGVWILMVVVGCTEIVKTPESPTILPTCPAINTPSPPDLNQPTKLVFVLLEGTPSHSEHSIHLLEKFSNKLPDIVALGDQVVFGLMEPTTLEASVLFNEKSSPIPFPPLPTPLPQLVSVTTVIPTANTTPQSKIAEIAATKQAEQTRSANEVDEKRRNDQYVCAMYEWTNEYQRVVDTWRAEENKAKREFVLNVNEKIRNINPQMFQETTRVFEALSIASIVFSEECQKYDDCVLLLLSDMSEWRHTTPENLNINLSGVDIIVALEECRFLYQENCEALVQKWEPILTSYGSKSIKFTTGTDFEETLEQFSK
jgi:hypothetical protein